MPRKNNTDFAVPSLKKRYAVKVVSNVAAPILGLGVQYITTRGLGPEGYGVFSFLIAFFAAVFAFLDNGLNAFLSTKLAHAASKRLWSWFFVFVSIFAGIIAFIFVFAADVTGQHERFWPFTPPQIVWYGAVFSLLTWWYGLAARAADALGNTLASELIRFFQKLGVLLGIVFLWLTSSFSLVTFFIVQIVAFTVSLSVLLLWLRQRSIVGEAGGTLKFSDCAKQFWWYSTPLILSSLACLVTDAGDRWLLQRYGGSSQQGFFGFSQQISAMSMIFTSAMVPLLAREVALAHSKGNLKRIVDIFWRFGFPLYAIASMVASFVAFNSEWIATLIATKRFSGAALPMAIVALYPVHQTFGQIGGTIALSMERTKTYGKLIVIANFFGLALTYCLLSPRLGLNLGAVGLSLKLVISQLFSVNLLLFLVLRPLGIRMSRLLGQQVYILGGFLAMAYAAKILGNRVFVAGFNQVVSLVVSGCSYIVIVALVAYLQPGIIGLTRFELISFLKDVQKRLLMRRK